MKILNITELEKIICTTVSAKVTNRKEKNSFVRYNF